MRHHAAMRVVVLASVGSCYCGPATQRSRELLRFMAGVEHQDQPAASGHGPELLANSDDANALLRFMHRGQDPNERMLEQELDVQPGDSVENEETAAVSAAYEKWAAHIKRGAPRSPINAKHLDSSLDCGERVGCQDCTADKRCLWCTSPRRCLDAARPSVELDASCPLQAPRSSCMDFNLRQERKAFIRPCERKPGGMSRRSQRGCCGDGECANTGLDNETREDDQNCPADCSPEPVGAKSLPQKLVETAESFTTVFGKLKEVVHDMYHCEDTFDEEAGVGVSSPCSDQGSAHRPSQWLEELVLRDKKLLRTSTASEVATFNKYRRQQDRYRAKDNWYRQQKAYWSGQSQYSGFSVATACRVDMSCTEWPSLKFAMPRFGSLVVEFGAGLGQDTRNLAAAGYQVLGIEVSAEASAEAKAISAKTLSAESRDRFEFLNYDALALPRPVRRIDFLIDFTVYCALRHRYLARMYELWERILTPRHTIFMVSCWKGEKSRDGRDPNVPVPIHREDMIMDFAPVFDTLHEESCMKNQELGGPDGAHCFWLQLKPESERNFSGSTCTDPT